MILDTSLVLRILKDRGFFEKIREKIDEEVKITSISVYELLRGAEYIRARYGRAYECELVRRLVGELEVLPFIEKDSEIAAAIWARLRERGREVSDADIMISAICLRSGEKLLTLDEDFKVIGEVAEEFKVEVLRA